MSGLSRRPGRALALAVGLALAAATPNRADGPAVSTIVADVGDAYFELLLEQSPLLRLKRKLAVERLPDVSLAHEQAIAARAEALLGRLGQAKRSELSHEEALSFEVLDRQLRVLVAAPRFHELRFMVTPYSSPISEVNQVFAALPLATEADRARYLSLLAQYPDFAGGLRARTESQARLGIRVPREELDTALGFLKASIGTDASPYAVAPARLAGLSAETARGFSEQVARRVAGDVNPALSALVELLSADYRQAAPAGVGLGQFPGGPEYYAWLVKYHTTLDATPEDVHSIGVAEVERIETEMAAVRAELGFTGSPTEFKRALNANPRFFAATPEEVGARLMAYVNRLDPKLDALFERRPKAPYGVKRLEPELEGGQTFGYYEVATGSDPVGYYRFNGSNLSQRLLLSAGPLIYHELVPGHHFQLNLARENTTLPVFRRESGDTAYTEGWGNYAACLAGEVGMYQDPYDRYGWLAFDMFISVRLVVDTGMNALGWSRQRAMDYMHDHLLETDTQIASESLRYSCDIPGQALGYKMGLRTMLELREKAKSALGERFDIRRLHEALLGSGSLPLGALSQHVDWFIEQERAR